MIDLTKAADEALKNAHDQLMAAYETEAGGTVADRETQAAGAIVSAITALCYEIAALRDGTYTKLADIETTLYSKLNR